MKSFNSRHIFLLLIAAMAAVFSAGAQKWKLYSSFDNKPVKIIDTPEKTYFLAHQQLYQKNFTGYDFPSLALFEYDKSHPSDGITAVISKGQMSRADVRVAEYSPAGGYLLIGYHSGIIDLIDNDGTATTIDALTHSSLPGGSIINSVTFDATSGDAWVATEGGYLHIDAATRNVARKGAFDTPVSWIGQAGDQLLAVSEGKLYESATLSPRSFSNFSPISGISSVLALMPLSDTGFVCLSGIAGSDVSLVAFKKDDAKWKHTTIGVANFHAIGKDFSVTHQYEPNIIPNRDGYLIYSGEKVWQIKSEDENGAELCAISLPGISLPVGSWDMRDFWSYENRGKFRRHHADYGQLAKQTTATWSTVGEPIRPNAPASFISTYINYSPAYGHLVVNHGQVYEFLNNNRTTPALLSGKKGEDWTVYSQVYNPPRSLESNPDIKQAYTTHIHQYPVAEPQGLAVDPQNPDWVSCGSTFGGIFFMDLSDPAKDLIHFAAPNDYFNVFPGFVATTPQQTWYTFSFFSNPEFDAEGRMWSFCANPFEMSGHTEPAVNVKFITTEQRKAFYEAAPENYSSLKSWTTIGLPIDNCTNWDRIILCGKHPKNRNRVFAFTSGNGNTIIILDHHGHPEDASQIDFKTATHIEDDKGWQTQFRYVSSVAEDPSTGDIIVATLDGLYVIEADSQAKDGIIRGRHLTLKNGTPGDIVPTEAHIFKVIFDNEGRMWIGTRNMGVVGVNKGRTEVIARFNTGNSPIPSDWVTGLGWNPHTRSLMISTDRGLAEVFPDVTTSVHSTSAPTLSRNVVRPDYNGAVEIRNLPDARQIIIKNAEGKEVRRIENGRSSIAEWDLRDSSGQSVAPGVYTICIDNLATMEITVMRQ
ncbi:MAG: hypothetical protein K2M93_06995 [Muribaculaceae bacterium]|nr:hypothetical protein [Muribaculaceae bacterium]